MQTYTRITNDFTGEELPGKIDENLQSLKSDFSGTAFPTSDLVEGMTCYRTDLDTEYKYIGGAWKVSGVATQAQAEEGVDDTKMMTPKGVNWRLRKDRQLNTYTSLSALGLTYQNTIAEICETLPAYSMLTFYVSALNTSSNYLTDAPPPTSGLLEIIKGVNTTIPVKFFLTGQDNAYRAVASYTTYNNLGFSGWSGVFDSSGIATQSQAETGTDNTTVMTPLRTKQFVDKNYLPLKGGTMEGSILLTGETPICNTRRTSNTQIRGGLLKDDGARIVLYGAEYGSVDSIYRGLFEISTCDIKGNRKSLFGYTDGRLSWDGKNVALAENVQSNNIVTISPTIIESDNVSVSALFVTQIGNVVTLRAEMTLKANQSDWFTLAKGLPKAAGGSNLYNTVMSWNSSFVRGLRIAVTQSGELQIRYGGATIFAYSFTYITDEEV